MLASQSERYQETDTFQLLLRASASGDVEQIRQLLENEININEGNEIGQTPLLVASITNQTDAVKLLLEKGAKVEQKDIGGYTALHLTTNIDTLNVLLQHINAEVKSNIINATTKRGQTPLHEAALHGPTEKVQILLSNGALANSEDVNGSTPLHYTLAQSGDGDIAIVQALLEAGADVNKQNAYLQTPLAIACKQHQFMSDTIPILLTAGADPMVQTNEGNTALHVLFFGTSLFEPMLSVDLVEEIVQSNRKCLETANLFGEFPIHGALSKRRNGQIVQRLLQYSPELANVTDGLGRTILHYACEKNYVDVLTNFLDHPNYSTLVNKSDHFGRTVLHYSCMYSTDGESVQIILRSKIFHKCHLKDCFGLTAYQYVEAREKKVQTKLIEHFETCVKTKQDNACEASISRPKEYRDVVEVPNQLPVLLSQIQVNVGDVLSSSLRPLKSAEHYVNEIWTSCKAPVKDMEKFDEQRKRVERFMNTLIMLMEDHDGRFCGKLLMRGSAYEGTMADSRGDFDYMLDIEELGKSCTAVEGGNDPPGFVRLQLISGQDAGIFKDFFDREGFLNSEKFLSTFSLSVMYALNQPSLWLSNGFDFFPKLTVTWKERPALSISCRMYHLSAFVPVSIDFLPAVHCKGWWPNGNTCGKFLEEKSLQQGCQMIIKPPNVPYYQHAKFGIPHHYLKMSFSEAETRLFQRSHLTIRKAFIVSKLLLNREVEIPRSILDPELDKDSWYAKQRLSIQPKTCLTSFILKQSLLNVLEEFPLNSDASEDNIYIWVQRIFSRLQKCLKEGNLPSIFLPSQNYLHTYQPDDSLESIRNIIVQVVCHSLIDEEIPLNIDYAVSWHRRTSEFERTVHKRFRYLSKILQSPEERE